VVTVTLAIPNNPAKPVIAPPNTPPALANVAKPEASPLIAVPTVTTLATILVTDCRF